MKPVTATRNFAKYIAAALVAVACTVQEPIDKQAPSTSEPASSVTSPTVHIQFSDELLALIEEDLAAGVATKSAGLNSVLEELGIEKLERVFPDAGEFEERSRAMGMHRFYKATLRENMPVTKASVALEEVPGIVSAHPDRRFRLRSFTDPNDEYYSRMWNLYNKKSAGADINVREVWEKYTTGNSKVIVVVVDESVDPNHEDLKPNLWVDDIGHSGFNFARSGWDLSFRDQDTGHGTHVAGIISAVNNNGKGVASVAGGDYAGGVQGVRLLSCAIFSGDKSADNAAIGNAIKYGADNGAVIAQNSWGYYADGILGDEEDGKVSAEEMAALKSLTINSDPEIRAAVDYFIKYAGCDAKGNQLPESPMQGGLVFFAAGNEGHLGVDYDPYCSYEPIISVGAFRENGARADYSNFGSWVDIAAPGGHGTTLSNSVISTVPLQISESGYAGMVGTSMACPHASGVAALIISYFGGPGFTNTAAREILFAGLGETIGGSKPVGRKLDALASFEYGVQHYTPGGNPSETPEPPVLKLKQTSVEVHAHEEVTVSYSVYDPNGDAVTLTLEPGSRAISLNQDKNCLVIGGWKDEPGTYTATLTASDGALFTKVPFTYTLLPNHAPVVWGKVDDILLSGLQKVGSVPLAGLFYDDDGEELAVQAASLNPECVKAGVSDNRVLITPVGYGNATVTISATDFKGEDAAITFEVAVVNPDDPVHVTPEVASTFVDISIETGNTVTVDVKLYSSTGTLVLETQKEASAFRPVHLDISALAPGRYTAVLQYNGLTRKLRIMKY